MTPDPATALDRAISFRYVFNVRDLGGLATTDGREVRRGMVFRADGVHRLDGEDLELARRLGLRTVIDLRTVGEVERSGGFPVDRLPVEWHHLPVIRSMWSEDDLVATSGAAEFLRDRYVDMLVEGAPSIGRALELVADGAPVLFHCAAGKDRTGVVAAVLLGVLGVAHDDIAQDYHLSAPAMATFVDWLTLEFPEALDAMTSQPPEYLEAPVEAMRGFLEAVDDSYGSMEGLVAHLGVGDEVVDRLRTTLLE
ncbi:MAG: tyrosine-protein phosphatase [Acidimicrobiales bacterium]|nr:tyrosine-protein phosphatase [Acidimicrobiales bacterium]